MCIGFVTRIVIRVSNIYCMAYNNDLNLNYKYLHKQKKNTSCDKIDPIVITFHGVVVKQYFSETKKHVHEKIMTESTPCGRTAFIAFAARNIDDLISKSIVNNN